MTINEQPTPDIKIHSGLVYTGTRYSIIVQLLPWGNQSGDYQILIRRNDCAEQSDSQLRCFYAWHKPKKPFWPWKPRKPTLAKAYQYAFEMVSQYDAFIETETIV